MKITVTQQDIDGGIPSSLDCPIAKALTRAGIAHWGVSTFGYYVGPKTIINLPYCACRFIRLFDSKQYVEPFEFEIEDMASL